jgi:hypothetical protein
MTRGRESVVNRFVLFESFLFCCGCFERLSRRSIVLVLTRRTLTLESFVRRIANPPEALFANFNCMMSAIRPRAEEL